MPGRADRIFFLAADPQHDRPSSETRQMGGNRHAGVAGAFRAEATTTVFGDEDQVFRGNANIVSQCWNRKTLTLAGAINEALAVLPVGHDRSRFHGMV